MIRFASGFCNTGRLSVHYMFSCLSEEQYFDCFRYRSNGYAGVVQDKFSWVLLRLTESVDRTGAHRFDQPQRSFFDKTEGFSGSYDKAASDRKSTRLNSSHV